LGLCRWCRYDGIFDRIRAKRLKLKAYFGNSKRLNSKIDKFDPRSFKLFAFCFQLNMYIIKVKGVAKIPDYVQLRDDHFTLLAYFRVDRPEKSLDKVGLSDKAEYIMNVIKDLPFGQILKLDI
jgi:hypothetical protein